MDRAQPGARGSTNRNIEFGEATGQHTDGWVVPADEPTLSAQRYTSLDETEFDEFDVTYTADSLTVTVDPGEAFIDGWLARDGPTDVDLEANVTEQTVVIGWDPDAIYDDQQHATRDGADRVIVERLDQVGVLKPTLAIWEFDTDANGVIGARDLRPIGTAIQPDALDIPSLVVAQPDRLPIVALDDGESVEVPIPLANGATLEVYRWGAYDVTDGSAPAGLVCELVDGTDTVQTSENTVNSQDAATPVASHENTSGSNSVFKLRAKNTTGGVLDSPGVGCHFGYRVP
jgi:hypothetical protein